MDPDIQTLAKMLWLSRTNNSPLWHEWENPENHTHTLKLNNSASESLRELKLGLIELYGNTE